MDKYNLENEIKTLQKHYNDAEKAIKIVEVLRLEGVVIPAVNELRYAGKHLLLAINAQNEIDKNHNINQAINHTKRAEYDCYDAGILFCLKMCNKYKKDYKNIVITQVCSSYIQDSHEINKIQSSLAEDDRKNKEEFFKEKQEQFNTLYEIYVKWENCREELNKIISQQEEDDKHKSKNTMISAVTCAIAIATILLSLLFNFI